MTSLTAVVPATNAPDTLAACLEAIRAADQPPEDIVVVTEGRGAAEARNAGAREATGDVVVFVDADVLPHSDAFARIRQAFDADPDLTAIFGSYDDTPADPGVVSGFRNLLHYHVHHEGAGPAQTFWTGLGGVRRSVFGDVGGFDPAMSYMEDVELGMRLHRAGGRIVLDPSIQGQHLKAWTLPSMVRTDLVGRGIPWVELLLRNRDPSVALNLGWRHRVSALASLLVLLGVLRRRASLVAVGATGLVVLNRRFYRLLAEQRGLAHAAAGVPLHALHHVVGIAAVPAGVVRHLCRTRRRPVR
jgi:glycosyltransferase involved in cell wall biosynthesis